MASRFAQQAARHCAALASRHSTPLTGVQHARLLAVRSGGTIQPLAIARAGGWRVFQVACFSSHDDDDDDGDEGNTRTSTSTSTSATLGPMNRNIRARVVNVVDDDGSIRRRVPLADALQEAASMGVDLVQVANDGEVVCRMFNAQKRLFALKKAMKNKKPKQDKEVFFGVKTEIHDLKTKAAQLHSFLAKGHKVKVTVKFGKEFHLQARAFDQLKLIQETVGTDVGVQDEKIQEIFGGICAKYIPKPQK